MNSDVARSYIHKKDGWAKEWKGKLIIIGIKKINERWCVEKDDEKAGEIM